MCEFGGDLSSNCRVQQSSMLEVFSASDPSYSVSILQKHTRLHITVSQALFTRHTVIIDMQH